jgi:hypothetical protein
MEPVVVQWGLSVSLAAISGWVGYAFGQRRERNHERRQRAFAAAESLVAPLRVLQSLIRRLGRTPVMREDVAVAFERWFSTYDECGHRLPLQWRHLPRSVRDAAGTVFGGIAFVDLRPDSRELELVDPDCMWQDFADDYLEYCAAVILRWGESSLKRPVQLNDYERWLVATERRELVGRVPPLVT